MQGTSTETLEARPAVREFVAALQRLTGLSIKLVRPDRVSGSVICSPFRNPICAAVCRGNRARRARRDIAVRLQPDGGESTPADSVVQCFAGLCHLSLPIMVGGQHVATLVAGQVLRRRPTDREFNRVCEFLKPGPTARQLSALRKAYAGARVVSDGEFHDLLTEMKLHAEHLARHAAEFSVGRPASHPPPPAAVAQAQEYVRGHLQVPLTTELVAQGSHLSKGYFCKLFKQATGQTFLGYVNRVRVAKAKELLADRARRISEVAYEAGYQSIPHFNRVFKAQVGQSPSEYRAGLPL